MILKTKNQPSESAERPAINYPCTWIYKVIGEDTAQLRKIIIDACAPADVTVSLSRSSGKGKYHSLNAELLVPDEDFRLKIYDSLKNNPAVKIVL